MKTIVQIHYRAYFTREPVACARIVRQMEARPEERASIYFSNCATTATLVATTFKTRKSCAGTSVFHAVLKCRSRFPKLGGTRSVAWIRHLFA